MRRIDRYILAEMVVPGLVGGVLVVMLLVGNQLYGLLRYLYSGVPIGDVMLALAYFTPGVLMLAIPAALLLGTALSLNRLERDREILSMRMAGVRVKRIVLPLIVIGILASGGMFYLQEKVIPYTTNQAMRLTQKLAYGTTAALVQRDTVFKVSSGSTTYFIYVRDTGADRGKQILYGVTVLEVTPRGNPTWYTIPVAESDRGQWVLKSDPLTGEKVRGFYFPRNGQPAELTAESGAFNLPMEAFSFVDNQRSTPEEYTLQELTGRMRQGITGSVGYSMNDGMIFDRNTITFFVHRKMAAPLAALVAVLLAIPLAIHFGRSGGYVGLLLSVVVAFCFVITQQWMQVLAERSYLDPILAAWTPNILFTAIALVLLMREE